MKAALRRSSSSGSSSAATAPPQRQRRFQTLASTLGNHAMQGLAQRGQLRIEAPSGTITFDPAALGRGVSPEVDDRQAVERRTGVDLSAVRIHDSREARRIVQSVDSDLVTFGIDILRGAPATSAQMRHELAHIAQHGARPVDPSRPIVLGPRRSPEEHDAWSIALGGEPQTAGDPNVARREDPDDLHELLQPQFQFPQMNGLDDEALRAWIEAGSRDTEPRPVAEPWNPSLSQFDQTDDIFSLPPMFPTQLADEDHAAIVEYITSLRETDASPVLQPEPTAPLSLRIGSHSMPTFPTIDEDPFATTAPPCRTSCHGVVYQRTTPAPPPYDPTPDWEQSRDDTHAQALAQEGQTTEQTVEMIEMQVLGARGQAIAAAATRGELPPDLRELWQQATLAVEALRFSLPSQSPDAGAATDQPEADIDPELEEQARDAIEAFYWAMIDALQRVEALDAAMERRSRRLDEEMRGTQPQCPGRCHGAAPAARPPIHEAADPQSPWVIERAQRLNTVEGAQGWRDAIRDFDMTATTDLDVLLRAILPSDSPEVEQLGLATALQQRVTSLLERQPDAIRIPAVFYPKNDLEMVRQPDGSFVNTAQGYSWYLFLYQNANGEFVLKDLTSNREATNHEGADVRHGIESFALSRNWGGYQASALEIQYPRGVMERLFGELDSELRFPEGTLYYTLPGDRPGTLHTTASTRFSTWLGLFGLSLAALGLAIVTFGTGTPLAVALATGAFAASGVVGAASTAMDLAEREEQGLATDEDRDRAALFIAADLASVLTLGLGRIASAPGTFGRLASVAGRLYVPVNAVETALDIAQIYVMTEQFVEQFEVLQQIESESDRDRALARLVTIAIATGALQTMSLRGNLGALRRGLRPTLDADLGGTLSVRAHGEVDLPSVTTRAAASDVADQASSTSWRWRAPEAAPTEVDETIGHASVVVDIGRRGDGLVTGVQVRHGPGASASDIQLHEEIAELVRSFGGIQGQIRQAWRDILALFGRRRPPFEVELEIWKLEELARRRIARLRARGTSEREKQLARDELAVINDRLASAQRRASRALEQPESPTERAEIWMHDSPDGYPSRPEGMTWYRARDNRWQLRSLPGADHGGVRLRAEYDDAGNFLGAVSNRAQVANARVIGRRVDEVRDRLTAMGYSVDVNGRISRRGTHRDQMIGLTSDPQTGVIRESVRETSGQIQTRIYDGLTTTQKQRVDTLRTASDQTGNQEVVLLEGIYDLQCTWRQVIEARGTREDFIDTLELNGVSRTEAERITDGLLSRSAPLQLVRGTAGLRSYDYVAGHTARGHTVPSGGDVHHGDPLYLAGTHELTAGLAKAPHDAVHRFFNSLRLPAGPLRGSTLAPATLRSRVPRTGWRRGAATIHHGGATEGHIDYEAL